MADQFDEAIIRETADDLDRALARVAVEVSGGVAGADALVAELRRGETTPAVKAFLFRGAAMIRVREQLAAKIVSLRTMVH